MKHLMLVLFIVAIVAVPAMAQNVTFAWDPHAEAAQVTGFKLYQAKTAGGPYTLSTTFNGGSTVTGTIAKPGLGRYYFVLTAFTPEVESDYSNEVSLVVKPAKPNLKSVVLSALVKVKDTLWAAFTGKKKDNLRIVEE